MPTSNPLYEQLKGLVFIKDDPAFKTFDAVKQALTVAHELTGAVLNVYDDVRGDPAKQKELSDALVMFHNEYFAPIDLPINDFLESVIDAQLAGLYAPIVKAIDAKLDEKLPHGPDAVQ